MEPNKENNIQEDTQNQQNQNPQNSQNNHYQKRGFRRNYRGNNNYRGKGNFQQNQ